MSAASAAENELNVLPAIYDVIRRYLGYCT